MIVIDFICFIICIFGTMFFWIKGNYIFFIIENFQMMYYCLQVTRWLTKMSNIKNLNKEKGLSDDESKQMLREKQERENWHPRKDRLYLSSIDLKDVNWTGTEKEEK